MWKTHGENPWENDLPDYQYGEFSSPKPDG